MQQLVSDTSLLQVRQDGRLKATQAAEIAPKALIGRTYRNAHEPILIEPKDYVGLTVSEQLKGKGA